MKAIPTTVVLLGLSNVFMTFAWYAHLKDMSGRTWYVVPRLRAGVSRFSSICCRYPPIASALR